MFVTKKELKEIKDLIQNTRDACITNYQVRYANNSGFTFNYDSQGITANKRLDDLESKFNLLLEHLGLEEKTLPAKESKRVFVKKKNMEKMR